MASSAANGKIMSGFNSKATFNPVHQDDVARAVAHQLASGANGHFALGGNKQFGIKQLLGMVERSSNKGACSETSPLIHSITSLIDDFFVGNTHDGNMGAMVSHYAEHGDGN